MARVATCPLKSYALGRELRKRKVRRSPVWQFIPSIYPCHATAPARCPTSRRLRPMMIATAATSSGRPSPAQGREGRKLKAEGKGACTYKHKLATPRGCRLRCSMPNLHPSNTTSGHPPSQLTYLTIRLPQ